MKITFKKTGKFFNLLEFFEKNPENRKKLKILNPPPSKKFLVTSLIGDISVESLLFHIAEIVVKVF